MSTSTMVDTTAETSSDPTCSSCAKLKEALEASKKEHALTLKKVKEKIISTDELIKKYQQKCLESDKNLQQATDFTMKLEAAQMKIEALQAQLDKSLHSSEPLRKNVARLHREKSLADSTISELQEKLQTFEKTNSELLNVTKLKEEQECRWRLEKQVQAHEMQKQKKSLQKSEATIAKLQEQIKKEKEQNKEKTRLLSQANRRAAKFEQQLEKSKEEIQSIKLEAQLAKTLGKNKTETTPKPRQRQKPRQPHSPPKERKQPSSSGSHPNKHLEHIIEELAALTDIVPALSPLPPSPEKETLENSDSEEESGSESSSEAGSEDGSSDYSLGDLADILTGDQSDAKNLVRSPMKTRSSTDQNLENSFKETTQTKNRGDSEEAKNESSAIEAPNESTASEVNISNVSFTNCNVGNPRDNTSNRETLIQEGQVKTHKSEISNVIQSEPCDKTSEISNKMTITMVTSSPQRKGKRRMTPPKPRVMTRSRAKAMKLSSSSDADSSSERETGKELNVSPEISYEMTNTGLKRNSNAKKDRTSEGVDSGDKESISFVSFVDASKTETKSLETNEREVRDHDNCPSLLSDASNSDDDDVTRKHGNASERGCSAVSFSGLEEQLDDEDKSHLFSTETEAVVTCYHGNDGDEPGTSAASLPGSVEREVLEENSEAFSSAVDSATTNIPTKLESESESEIGETFPLRLSRKDGSDINEISSRELSNRTDASTCVSTKTEIVEKDAEPLASVTNEVKDRTLQDSKNGTILTDSGQSSRLQSEENAFEKSDKSLEDNNNVLEDLETVREQCEADSTLLADNDSPHKTDFLVQGIHDDSGSTTERNVLDLSESCANIALNEKENTTVEETSAPVQEKGNADSSRCEVASIEMLTADSCDASSAKVEGGVGHLTTISSKATTSITSVTSTEGSSTDSRKNEILEDRELTLNGYAVCDASNKVMHGCSIESIENERFTVQDSSSQEEITALSIDSLRKSAALKQEEPSSEMASSTVNTIITTNTTTSTASESYSKQKLKDEISEDETLAPGGNLLSKEMVSCSGELFKTEGSEIQDSNIQEEVSNLSAEPLVKDFGLERDVPPRTVVQKGSSTSSEGATHSNFEIDLASCSIVTKKEEDLSYSDCARDAPSSRTVINDIMELSMPIELQRDLLSSGNVVKEAKKSLVSREEIRKDSDVRRDVSCSRTMIKERFSNSKQEKENPDIEKHMPCSSIMSDSNTCNNGGKHSDFKEEISSDRGKIGDTRKTVSASSAPLEQERTQLEGNDTALQSSVAPDKTDSSETSAVYDVQGESPMEALLDNLDGLLEDFPVLSPLPPSPCPSDDDVCPASPISYTDLNDEKTHIVTNLTSAKQTSDTKGKCRRKRDENTFTELISKSDKRTAETNPSDCITRSNKEEISGRNRPVKSKANMSESTSCATQKVSLQHCLQKPVSSSRIGVNVSLKRTSQQPVSESAKEKTAPQSKRIKTHLNVPDKQQSPRLSDCSVASRITVKKDTLKQPLKNGVANKRPILVSNKGPTLVDKNGNVGPTLAKRSDNTNSAKATDSKDSKYRPLSVRPSYLTEVQYVFKCLDRMYEDNVELKVVVGRLTSKKCISSSTPVASAIVQFLKQRRDDLLPQILDQLEQDQSEGRVKNWTPVISGFESRLLEVVFLLSSQSLFGNLVPQLVSLCSRSLISSCCTLKEEEIEWNLSLCRVLTALCQFKDNLACARAVCYDVIRSLYGLQNAALELIVTMVTVWPEVLKTRSDILSAEKSPLVRVLKLVLLNWTHKSPSADLGDILRVLCCWEDDCVTEEELRNFGLQLVKWLCEEGGAAVSTGREGRIVLESQSFEVVKSLELLSCVLGWQWTLNELIVNNIWQILITWADKETTSGSTKDIYTPETNPRGDRSEVLETGQIRKSNCCCRLVTDENTNSDIPKEISSDPVNGDEGTSDESSLTTARVKERGKKRLDGDEEVLGICSKCGKFTGTRSPKSQIVPCIQLLGVLGRIAIENGQNTVAEILDMLCGLIESTSPDSEVPYAIQLAAAISLLDVSPWQPGRVASVLSKWLSALKEADSAQAPACVSQGLVCLKSILRVNRTKSEKKKQKP